MVTSQVELDLVAEVRVRYPSNWSEILAWEVSLYSYEAML